MPALSIRAMLCSACGVLRSFSHVENPTLVPSTAEQEDRWTEFTVLRPLERAGSETPAKQEGTIEKRQPHKLRNRPSCLLKVREKERRCSEKCSARARVGGNLEQRMRGYLALDKLRSQNHIYRFCAYPKHSRNALQCGRLTSNKYRKQQLYMFRKQTKKHI